MRTVAIVNYGMSNVDSVARAVEECGGHPVVTSAAAELERAAAIILPGVGAYPDAMRNLRARGLEDVLREQVVERRIPFLGICLGMQMLATVGWEVEETRGLGWVPGEVRRLPAVPGVRIPHIGWNEVEITRETPLLTGIESGVDFYFVHSYHFVCHDSTHEVARTPYCGGFTSAITKENIFGTQFHPEKSQKRGFQLLRNFLAA
ncbi:MAG: imidazole glycerol phosphate synthase subunit HisH [Deltaproteobacteria bacterium]|nr:imidazole glycerol phosphate synthase subunit HisH [Deltaproteobacteria bacterium]